MDIILYLTEILQTRKTVGIVGLGTLYKKKSPGKYNTVKHQFIPPSYQLAFTSEVKENDELINYISNKRNLTRDSAEFFVSDFAERLKSQLRDFQEADLEPLGKLKLVNEEVVFVGDQESSFGNEFYGMPSVVDINVISKETESTTTDEEEENAETELPESKTDAPITVLEEIEEENKLEEENPGQETTESVFPEVNDFDDQPVYEEIYEVEQVNNDQNIVPETLPVIEEVESEEINEEEETAEVNPIEPAKDEVPVVEQTEEEEVIDNEPSIPIRGETLTIHQILANKMRTIEVQEDNAPVIPPTTVQEIDVVEEEPKKGISLFVKFLIALFIIVVLGAIIYFVNPSFFDKYIQKNYEGKPVQPISTLPKDSLNNKVSPVDSQKSALVIPTKDTSIVDSSTVTLYEVLISAENTEAKADARIYKLAKRGIKAKKVRLSKTMVNISAGTFLNEKDARKLQDSLRIVFKNPEIYTKPIKPKK